MQILFLPWRVLPCPAGALSITLLLAVPQLYPPVDRLPMASLSGFALPSLSYLFPRVLFLSGSLPNLGPPLLIHGVAPSGSEMAVEKGDLHLVAQHRHPASWAPLALQPMLYNLSWSSWDSSFLSSSALMQPLSCLLPLAALWLIIRLKRAKEIILRLMKMETSSWGRV